MERSFKVKTFERWMRKTGLTDAILRVAVEEMSRGLIDASLGGHLVKKGVSQEPDMANAAVTGPLWQRRQVNTGFFYLDFRKKIVLISIN